MNIMLISAVLLVNIFIVSDKNAFQARDWIFLGIFLIPYAVVYICLLIFFISVLAHPFRELYCISPIMFCIDILTLDRIQLRARLDPFCRCSENICFSIINYLMLLVSLAIVIVFLPFIIICLHFGKVAEFETLERISWVIEAFSIILYVIFNIFCVNCYGYFSFVILSLCVIYLILGIIYFVVSLVSPAAMHVHVIFSSLIDTLALLMVILIVQHDGMDIFHILFLIYYIAFNMPFLRTYIVMQYLGWKYCSKMVEFLEADNHNVVDKYYHLLHHAIFHGDNNSMNHGMEIEVSDNDSDLDNVQLLSNQNGNNMHSTYYGQQCYRMVHDYLMKSDGDRFKSVRSMIPVRHMSKKEMACFVLCIMYGIFSFSGAIYPAYWFINYCGTMTIEMHGEVLFVLILFYLHYLLWICWIIIIIKQNELMSMYLMARLFLWSFPHYPDRAKINESHLWAVEMMHSRQEMVRCVLEINNMQIDIAMIIFSYLYSIIYFKTK